MSEPLDAVWEKPLSSEEFARRERGSVDLCATRGWRWCL